MGKIVETLSDGTKIINTDLSDILVNKATRKYFGGLLNQKSKIESNFDNIKNNKEIRKLCKRIVSEEYRVINNDDLILPCVFKYEGKKIKFFNDYNVRHLKSSVIKNALINQDISLTKRTDIATYLLYYFWFTKKDNINDITRNVLVDLESIISIIIEKSVKHYKNINTTKIVESLRQRWNTEKLLSMV